MMNRLISLRFSAHIKVVSPDVYNQTVKDYACSKGGRFDLQDSVRSTENARTCIAQDCCIWGFYNPEAIVMRHMSADFNIYKAPELPRRLLNQAWTEDTAWLKAQSDKPIRVFISGGWCRQMEKALLKKLKRPLSHELFQHLVSFCHKQNWPITALWGKKFSDVRAHIGFDVKKQEWVLTHETFTPWKPLDYPCPQNLKLNQAEHLPELLDVIAVDAGDTLTFSP